MGPVDDAHSTLTEFLEDLIVGYDLPDHRCLLDGGNRVSENNKYGDRGDLKLYKATTSASQRQLDIGTEQNILRGQNKLCQK